MKKKSPSLIQLDAVFLFFRLFTVALYSLVPCTGNCCGSPSEGVQVASSPGGMPAFYVAPREPRTRYMNMVKPHGHVGCRDDLVTKQREVNRHNKNSRAKTRTSACYMIVSTTHVPGGLVGGPRACLKINFVGSCLTECMLQRVFSGIKID